MFVVLCGRNANRTAEVVGICTDDSIVVVFCFAYEGLCLPKVRLLRPSVLAALASDIFSGLARLESSRGDELHASGYRVRTPGWMRSLYCRFNHFDAHCTFENLLLAASLALGTSRFVVQY